MITKLPYIDLEWLGIEEGIRDTWIFLGQGRKTDFIHELELGQES